MVQYCGVPFIEHTMQPHRPGIVIDQRSSSFERTACHITSWRQRRASQRPSPRPGWQIRQLAASTRLAGPRKYNTATKVLSEVGKGNNDLSDETKPFISSRKDNARAAPGSARVGAISAMYVPDWSTALGRRKHAFLLQV